MAILFLVVGGALVFVIAAVLVGRETGRLRAEAPRPVFDLDEAVSWIADGLPFEVAARLSHAELRQLLLWSLDHLRLIALSGNGSRSGPEPSGEVVMDEASAIAYVLARATEAGLDCTPEQVRAVLEAQAAYLEVIGAAGRQEPPPPGGTGPLRFCHQREEVVQLSDDCRTLEVVGR